MTDTCNLELRFTACARREGACTIIPAIALFGPLLFPIAKAVGIHEVHYAMVVILATGIGLFAPPFGVGYYAACAMAGSSRSPACGRSWAICSRW